MQTIGRRAHVETWGVLATVLDLGERMRFPGGMSGTGRELTWCHHRALVSVLSVPSWPPAAPGVYRVEAGEKVWVREDSLRWID